MAMFFLPLLILGTLPVCLVVYTRVVVYPKLKKLNSVVALKTMKCVANVQVCMCICRLMRVCN